MAERKIPLSERPLTEPHESRLGPAHPRRELVLRLHELAMEHGDAGYIDPSSGLFVTTASYLADRGTCCDQGCRHCPYVV